MSMMTENGTTDTVEVASRIEALSRAITVIEPERRNRGPRDRPEADEPSTPAPPASPEHDTPESPEKAEDVHGHPETPV